MNKYTLRKKTSSEWVGIFEEKGGRNFYQKCIVDGAEYAVGDHVMLNAAKEDYIVQVC